MFGELLPNLQTISANSEFQRSRPNTAKSQLSSTSAFKRLDTTASLRRGKSSNELRNNGNLGPGSYDINAPALSRPASRRSGGSPGMAKSNIPAQYGIVRPATAPPVGTYDLPRILSPGVSNIDSGLQITSPFLSRGGRNKVLMTDGIHYSTLREDLCLSNIGPGYYNTRDNWSPVSFVKYNKSRAVSPSARTEITLMGTLNRNTRSRGGNRENDKPWRQNASLSPKKSKDTSILDPFDTADIDASLRAAQNRREESQRDVDAVRNLPVYFQ